FDRSCEHCRHPGHGRPRLVADGPHFSISHSADRVLLALCDTAPVGADVESTGRDIDRLRRLILHPAEAARPAGPDLLRVWVRKEAVLKATGRGLALAMAGVDLDNLPPGTAV